MMKTSKVYKTDKEIEDKINGVMAAINPTLVEECSIGEDRLDMDIMICALGKMLSLAINFATEEHPENRAGMVNEITGMIKRATIEHPEELYGTDNTTRYMESEA